MQRGTLARTQGVLEGDNVVSPKRRRKKRSLNRGLTQLLAVFHLPFSNAVRPHQDLIADFHADFAERTLHESSLSLSLNVQNVLEIKFSFFISYIELTFCRLIFLSPSTREASRNMSDCKRRS